MRNANLVQRHVAGRRNGFSGCGPATISPLGNGSDQSSEGPAGRERSLVDEPLVARARTGDEEAARTLTARLYPTILRLVRSNLPRRTSEEDLVQEVFLKIFSKLDQFAGAVPLENWVSRITVNTCINRLKHESVRPELRLADLSEAEEAVVQHYACCTAEWPVDKTRAARELVNELLARLKPEERCVITLLHIDERSTKEISRTTGWSVAQVKVRAFRARHKMRKVWRTSFQGQKP